MVKRLHWTDMGMCLDVAPDNRPLYVTASDYDAAQARIRELEAENVCSRARYERCESVNGALADRIAQLEPALSQYLNAKTPAAMTAADAAARKLLQP